MTRCNHKFIVGTKLVPRNARCEHVKSCKSNLTVKATDMKEDCVEAADAAPGRCARGLPSYHHTIRYGTTIPPAWCPRTLGWSFNPTPVQVQYVTSQRVPKRPSQNFALRPFFNDAANQRCTRIHCFEHCQQSLQKNRSILLQKSSGGKC